MAKKFAFAKGLATGVVATAATVAGAIFAVKKKIIEPEEEKAALCSRAFCFTKFPNLQCQIHQVNLGFYQKLDENALTYDRLNR